MSEETKHADPHEVIYNLIGKGPTNNFGFCFYCENPCECSGPRAQHHCFCIHKEGCLWVKLNSAAKFNEGILPGLTYRCRVEDQTSPGKFFKELRYVAAIGEGQGLDQELYPRTETWVAYYHSDDKERTLVPLADFIKQVEAIVL